MTLLAEFAESFITFPNPLHPKHIPHLTCCQRMMAHTASEPKSCHYIAFPTLHSLLCEDTGRNHQITCSFPPHPTPFPLHFKYKRCTPPSLPSAGGCWRPGSRGSCGSGWRCPGGCAAAQSWGCWAWWRSPAGAAPGPAQSARRSTSPRPARTASGEGRSGAAAAASAAPWEAGAAGVAAEAAWHKGHCPVLSLTIVLSTAYLIIHPRRTKDNVPCYHLKALPITYPTSPPSRTKAISPIVTDQSSANRSPNKSSRQNKSNILCNHWLKLYC